MLFKANELKGYTLNGINGNIGVVKEFCSDDRHWTIRYLEAGTGKQSIQNERRKELS